MLTRLIRRIADWVTLHAIVMCASCRRLLFEKNAETVYHRIQGLVKLCPECYQEIYGYHHEK